MLRGMHEASWARLPSEAAAEEVWPAFRDAVIAAVEEHQMSEDLDGEPSAQAPDPADRPPH
jgi:hypothetical protein